jgi:hypothetical protein
LVVNGYAKGYISEELFLRLHYWVINVPPTGAPNPRVVLHPIQNIGFIAEKEPWSSSVGQVRNAAGTVCIYDVDSEYPNGRRYVVPSEAIHRKYQLNWNVRLLLDDEFNNIPVSLALS